MRLSANAGSLSIVFPQEIWEELLANAPTSSEPMPEELEELGHLKAQLEGYADEASCSVLREVPCGDTGLAYDLVLRPAEIFAMTTGYYFAPVVDEDALLSGDESLQVLCVRRRSCSTSRFEMPPELWRVLSGRLGWWDVQTTATGR